MQTDDEAQAFDIQQVVDLVYGIFAKYAETEQDNLASKEAWSEAFKTFGGDNKFPRTGPQHKFEELKSEILYCGAEDVEKTIKEFQTGEIKTEGRTLFGPGQYFTIKLDKAKKYAKDSSGDNIMIGKLLPSAKVVTLQDLWKLKAKLLPKQKFFIPFKKDESDPTQRLHAVSYMLSDCSGQDSLFALMLGYDALRIEQKEELENGDIINNDTVVVMNREVMVQSVNPVASALSTWQDELDRER